MPTKDYYTILGVQRAASADEIKRAYRNLARTHHPDVADDKNEAEHRFKDINEAYGVLSDPNKRARYDQFGTADGTNGARLRLRWIRSERIRRHLRHVFRRSARRVRAPALRRRAAARTCATTCKSRWRRRSRERRARCSTGIWRRALRARGAEPSPVRWCCRAIAAAARAWRARCGRRRSDSSSRRANASNAAATATSSPSRATSAMGRGRHRSGSPAHRQRFRPAWTTVRAFASRAAVMRARWADRRATCTSTRRFAARHVPPRRHRHVRRRPDQFSAGGARRGDLGPVARRRLAA